MAVFCLLYLSRFAVFFVHQYVAVRLSHDTQLVDPHGLLVY